MNEVEVKHVFPNTEAGKRLALEWLDFASKDAHAWWLSVPQRTPGDVRFSNWVHEDNLKECVFCIKYASQAIYAYRMGLRVVDDQEVRCIESGYRL
jgi:hypothetical protein